MYRRALEDLDGELRAYRKLAGMLEEQFTTAMRLDTTMLARISETIAEEVRLLDEQGRKRPRLVGALSDIAKRSPAAGKAAQHRVLEKRCAELKALAIHCKTLTMRNGQLLASQYETMQRVLHGERHTYAAG
ncbi:MAG: flagellar export chaperone FlgN [Rhodanobacter sp.]